MGLPESQESAKTPSLHKIVAGVADVLLPSFCAGCEVSISSADSPVCADCIEAIAIVGENHCKRCGAPQGPYVGAVEQCVACEEFTASWPFKEVVALAEYDPPLREIILNLKFRSRHAVAGLLGAMLARVVQLRGVEIDIIIPLPLDRTRRFERGYDQALLIARALGEALSLPVLTGVLKRKKKTKAQAQLSAAERRNNVKGAFTLGKHAGGLKDRQVLLVDDVLTTGATLTAAGVALKQAEPEVLHAAVVARAKY